jgi:hypothetical protein
MYLDIRTKFYKNGFRHLNVNKGDTRTNTQTARWSHKPTFIFQNRESRLKDVLVPTPFTPWTYMGGLEVKLHTSLVWALDAILHCTAALSPCPHWTDCPRASLDVLSKSDPLSLQRLEPRTIYPVTVYFTDLNNSADRTTDTKSIFSPLSLFRKKN